MITTANVATVVVPLGVSKRAALAYTKPGVYSVDTLKPKKKKKRSLYYGEIGMMPIYRGESLSEGEFTRPVGKDGNKWELVDSGKIGVWRTIKGKRYFFSDDGSGPVPSIPEGKDDDGEKDNIPNRKDVLKNVEQTLLKASRSGRKGKALLGPLKKMQSAVKADDPDAFKKAEAELAKATKKLKKKSG